MWPGSPQSARAGRAGLGGHARRAPRAAVSVATAHSTAGAQRVLSNRRRRPHADGDDAVDVARDGGAEHDRGRRLRQA
eukprot:4802261-Prymnesium_polylepis.1